MKQKISKTVRIPQLTLFVAGIAIVFSLMGSFLQGDKWLAPPAADKTKNPVISDAQSIAAGKDLFIKNCVSCHGQKGKGDGPKSADLEKEPGNFTLPAFKLQSDGAIYWKITEGKKPMPSFKLEMTEQQRWEVINYVRTLEIKK
jgi:mono/diheme cytochrome c family protein